MKEFYTYEQQLEKLRKDGLIIVGENEAIDFLRLEGYYNVIITLLTDMLQLLRSITNFVRE